MSRREPTRLEAHALVQADAGRVRQGDPGDRDAEALGAKAIEELGVEGAADALAVVVGGDVDRGLDRPVVGGAVGPAAGVGVADHLTVLLGDEELMGRRVLLDPPRELGGVGRHELEGDRRRFDAGRVDRRAGGAVALGIGGADRHRQVAHNRLPPMSREAGKVVRRSIGIVFADGGLLSLSGSAPTGGGGHGEEPLLAVLCDPDAAPVTFEEALLSTEYGEDGVQRRATLELWLDTRGRPAAARRRHADQLDRRRDRRSRDADRLLPLGARGARGPRPLRDRPGAWPVAGRSRRSSPTSAAC